MTTRSTSTTVSRANGASPIPARSVASWPAHRGYISTNVMKKASADRVKELLRIVDYLAKPFGTQEDLLITYGLSPADFTVAADGNPSLTSDGKARPQYVAVSLRSPV